MKNFLPRVTGNVDACRKVGDGLGPMAYVDWSLKPEAEKRFRRGHPWIFSSDLDHSPGRIEAGQWARVRSRSGEFLAWGYGHPNSLISFRVLSRNPQFDPWHPEKLIQGLSDKLDQALALRMQAGVPMQSSFRWLYGEVDGVPGLICDLYLVHRAAAFLQTSTRSWVAVLQSSTAGADRMIDAVCSALESEAQKQGALRLIGPCLGVVIARDSSARSMESLAHFPRSLRHFDCPGHAPLTEDELTCAVIEVEAAAQFTVDFINGQKTGFFLDQRGNTKLLCQILKARSTQPSNEFKVLDLFSYVGQWSVQVSQTLSALGKKAQCDIFDASAQALHLAKTNVERAGGEAHTFERDVLRAWEEIPVTHYDVVVCDPPALAKKKKDLPVAEAAYVKLFRESIRRVKDGGLIVISSCSGLVDEEAFQKIASDAVLKSGRSVAWIARGGHAADHPWRTEFPQGRYLKAQIGIVTERL